MNQKNTNLVWVDLEMTGLNPDSDRIIELACLITDESLNIVAEGPEMVISQPESVLTAMDKWNTQHHTESGLVEKVRGSNISEAAAEVRLLDFVKQHTTERTAPLCGNSIWQDRRFLTRYMPAFEGWLHYRVIDVSTIKELAGRWYPGLSKYQKEKSHTAMSDIRESIGELRYYQSHIFVPSI